MDRLPDRFLFMKVGNHAGESWEKILERKRREFERTGRTFWGYGGNACHPLSQVQPFARLTIREQGGIFIVMEQIDSRADPDVVPAREYSADGIAWEPIPEGIEVTGSRYALILDEIKPGDLSLELNNYEVGIGPSSGKAAEAYIQGHTDKACFTVSKTPRIVDQPTPRMVRKISYYAQVKEPYAVLLR
jgi:hypothetical protein